MIDINSYKEYLEYNPETGIFTWIKQPSGAVKAGTVAGCLMPNGYIAIRFKGPMITAHRLAFYLMHGYLPKIVDHINRNRSDNRIDNLREVTPRQSNINRNISKYNKSGKTGVSWCNTYNRYVVSIYIKNKRKFMGYFDNLELAIAKRQEAELLYYGMLSPN
jgi:hypothetical protein